MPVQFKWMPSKSRDACSWSIHWRQRWFVRSMLTPSFKFTYRETAQLKSSLRGKQGGKESTELEYKGWVWGSSRPFYEGIRTKPKNILTVERPLVESHSVLEQDGSRKVLLTLADTANVDATNWCLRQWVHIDTRWHSWDRVHKTH